MSIIASLKRGSWRLRDAIALSLDDLSRSIADTCGDELLGIDTRHENVDGAQGVFGDSRTNEPTRYSTLRRVLDYLQMGGGDVFVDYGCGKGRAVCLAAQRRLKKVIGVELDERAAGIARANLRRLKGRQSPAEIVTDDAVRFDPREGTVFFLFNPFGSKTLEAVLARIEQSLKDNPRKVRIVYLNARFENVMKLQKWLELETAMYALKPQVMVWRSI